MVRSSTTVVKVYEAKYKRVRGGSIRRFRLDDGDYGLLAAETFDIPSVASQDAFLVPTEAIAEQRDLS